MSVSVISSINPNYGDKTGGYTIEIFCTDPSTITSISINSVSSTIISRSSTSITVTVPPSSIEGDVNVVLVNTTGNSLPVTFTYGGNYNVTKLSTDVSTFVSICVDYLNNLYFLLSNGNLYTIVNGTKSTLSYILTGNGFKTIKDMMVISDSSNTYRPILELTYLSKIFIKYGENEMIIDMDTLDIITNTDIFEFIDYNNDGKGIYSIVNNTYHKRTKHTKFKKIICNINEKSKIILTLASDISIVDMHNISVDFVGIDSDKLGGGLVSQSKLVILDPILEYQL